jgi:putative DNA primase/helicase
MSFDNIPEELRALNQWVCWRAELRDGKVTKVPYQARKRGHVKASSTGTDTWSSFDHAQRRIAEYRDMDGIGFVFSATDPYLGIDLDDIEGEDSLGIESFIDRSGTYAEVSPSGTGIHLIGRAGIPHNDTGTGRRTKGIEVYQHGRYFTMTGNALDGEIRPIRDIQPIVNEFWSQWFPQKE